MKVAKKWCGLALLLAGIPGLLSAIELRPGTLRAWDDYIGAADARMESRVEGQQAFLWAEEAPERMARLQHGEILVSPVAGHGTRNVTNGLIHDWIGATFIPHATIEKLLAVVHDYDRYKDFYRPAVIDSKTLACTAAYQRFSMVWQKRVLFVNAAIEGQYEAREFAAGGRKGYNIANTVRVREIENYGQPNAYFLPAGQGNGFIWRLHSIARYEERDSGVYLELEAIALTRNIPPALGWMVNPVVNRLSIGSLAATLRETRDAVQSLDLRSER